MLVLWRNRFGIWDWKASCWFCVWGKYWWWDEAEWFAIGQWVRAAYEKVCRYGARRVVWWTVRRWYEDTDDYDWWWFVLLCLRRRWRWRWERTWCRWGIWAVFNPSCCSPWNSEPVCNPSKPDGTLGLCFVSTPGGFGFLRSEANKKSAEWASPFQGSR